MQSEKLQSLHSKINSQNGSDEYSYADWYGGFALRAQLAGIEFNTTNIAVKNCCRDKNTNLLPGHFPGQKKA